MEPSQGYAHTQRREQVCLLQSAGSSAGVQLQVRVITSAQAVSFLLPKKRGCALVPTHQQLAPLAAVPSDLKGVVLHHGHGQPGTCSRYHCQQHHQGQRRGPRSRAHDGDGSGAHLRPRTGATTVSIVI